jgi:hypothetical protein
MNTWDNPKPRKRFDYWSPLWQLRVRFGDYLDSIEAGTLTADQIPPPGPGPMPGPRGPGFPLPGIPHGPGPGLPGLPGIHIPGL